MELSTTDDDGSYFSQRRLEMLPLIPERRQRVLDIGCGEGRFSSAIRGVAELWGIEPDRPSADVAASRMYRVLPGIYDDVQAQL